MAATNAAVEKPKADKILSQVLSFLQNAEEDDLPPGADRFELMQTAVTDYAKFMSSLLGKTVTGDDASAERGGEAVTGKTVGAKEADDMEFSEEQVGAAREVLVAAGQDKAGVEALTPVEVMGKVLADNELLAKWAASLGALDAGSAGTVRGRATTADNDSNNYLLAKATGVAVGEVLAGPLTKLAEAIGTLGKGPEAPAAATEPPAAGAAADPAVPITADSIAEALAAKLGLGQAREGAALNKGLPGQGLQAGEGMELTPREAGRKLIEQGVDPRKVLAGAFRLSRHGGKLPGSES
jgi:hypothetical protein